MDFSDERSIFSNDPMSLDLNLQSNDFLTNYDDAQIPYFLDDITGPSISSVLNICEPTPEQSSQNVLCSNQQSSNSSKAQSLLVHQHSPSPQSSMQHSNRSHTLIQHHTYQPSPSHSFHDPPPPSHLATSKTFQHSIIPINQTQINYATNIIPDKEKPIVYSPQVINQRNILNSQNCAFNNKETLYHNNSMLNDPQFHSDNGINHHRSQMQHPQTLQSQVQLNLNTLQQNSNQFLKVTNNSRVHENQQFNNNLSTNNVPRIDINKNVRSNSLLSPVQNRDFFHSPSSSYYNSPKHEQQTNPFIQDKNQQVNTINKSGPAAPSSFFNETCCQIDKSAIVDKNLIEPLIKEIALIDTNTQVEKVAETNFSNNNVINSNQDSSSLANSNNSINKNEKIELESNFPVDLAVERAETKTVFIVKIVDQVVLNGQVVKETIVKNDEIIKHTGYIDWFTQTKNPEDNSLPITLATETESNDVEKIVPKSNNLKRNVNQCNKINETQHQEKKVKIRNSLPKSSQNELSEKVDSISQIQTEDKNNQADNETNDCLPSTSKIAEKKQLNLEDIELEDPIFRPSIDVNQKVLSRWIDKSYYPGKVISREHDSRWRIAFDDGGRRLVKEDEIISIEHIPRGQPVMININSGFVSKGFIRSYRRDPITDQLFYFVGYDIGLDLVENEYNERDVFLNSDNALSLLARRKQTVNSWKFADVDLSNIIPAHKRSRSKDAKKETDASISSLNSSTTELRTNLSTDVETLDNDSNSNLSSSTANSMTTNCSATKKSSKKTKSTQNKNVVTSNEEADDGQLNVSTNSRSINNLVINLKLDPNNESKPDFENSKDDEPTM